MAVTAKNKICRCNKPVERLLEANKAVIIDLGCLEEQEPEFAGNEARQRIVMRRGIDSDRARKLVKDIKSAKLKVQAAIQGDKLRVSGKKRDDLQAVIAMLRETDVGLPLQYENFRD